MAERLTIDKAIAHAKEVARENKYRAEHKLFHRNDKDEISACLQCAEEHEQLAEWLKELQHYKDLEEQGRLIELPCKIGDTVYVVEDWGYRKELKEREVGVIALKGINDFSKEFWEDVYGGILGNFSNIGKTVFFTKAEAEAALKEVDK